MSLINNIQEIIKEFIIEKYFNYLEEENILLIKNSELKEIIFDLYSNNNKNLKSIIREKLKTEMGNDYPGATIENIIFDIFQDYKINIDRITSEILKYQNSNYFEIKKNISENGLGLNIQIDGSFCQINGVKKEICEKEICEKEIFDTIKKYKYLYSINNLILNESNDMVACLKQNIIKNSIITLGLYQLND